MKAFVTGVGGQLGHDVMNELAKRGFEGVGTDLAPEYSGIQDGTSVVSMPYVQLDITDPDQVRKVMNEVKPDVCIHCAAWTAVDKAEEFPDKCRLVNAGGTENIAKVCEELDIPMMYFSTDYVFDGNGTRPWEPDDPYAPLDVYGKTKAEGEEAVIAHVKKFFILRIAWVFGTNGHNFIKTMLKLAKTHDTLRVVSDQIGTPTYTYDLARLVVDMIQTDKYGKYHVTNEGGYISWYDFTCEIFRQAGITNVKVIPVTSEEYGAAAKRPYNSRMNRSKITENGFKPLPDWKDALARYLDILKKQGETD
ncbi:MAG: dTDP-4-dehydrorhamnose reductase [Eubacteriales bacterium]|nr:dTDP-4-dehydrorhamnose reductase [Lachnospiraceae bacterium]MDD5860683.1 dTDP-4-dehydrorhamnose reductase [Eubacteriales bacterium]MCH4064404.1 dTDP-4-dehydrorhamnose reductase [Lachnospiraceae bacterium]MCH4102871.1 dTDP-4-dehydrorhamnose reductase [Lachnospiraceae bacterium]MCI1308860.1 dTDP-4-dehydrorhamnose reductase [Lachnospiraceae bacterium]